jgi:hypothetical protein
VVPRVSGDYVVSCWCRPLCAGPFDGRPNDPLGHGECRSVVVVHLDEGRFDDVELGGVSFAAFVHYPANVSAGRWSLGLVVDREAALEQARAVESMVLRGGEGPLSAGAPLIGCHLGTTREAVGVGGPWDEPAAAVGSSTQFTFEPFRALDGSPVRVRWAPYGLAEEFLVGRTSGTVVGFGSSFEPSSGEAGRFELPIDRPPSRFMPRI